MTTYLYVEEAPILQSVRRWLEEGRENPHEKALLVPKGRRNDAHENNRRLNERLRRQRAAKGRRNVPC